MCQLIATFLAGSLLVHFARRFARDQSSDDSQLSGGQDGRRNEVPPKLRIPKEKLSRGD